MLVENILCDVLEFIGAKYFTYRPDGALQSQYDPLSTNISPLRG